MGGTATHIGPSQEEQVTHSWRLVEGLPREEHIFYLLINVKTSDVFHHLEGKKRSTYLVYLVKELGQNKGFQSQVILKWVKEK